MAYKQKEIDQPKGYSDPRWEKYRIKPEHSEAVFDRKCTDADFFMLMFCHEFDARIAKDFKLANNQAKDQYGRDIEDNRYAKFFLAFRRENAYQFPLSFLLRHNIWTMRSQRRRIAEQIRIYKTGIDEGYDLEWFVNNCELLFVGQEKPQSEPDYREWVA